MAGPPPYNFDDPNTCDVQFAIETAQEDGSSTRKELYAGVLEDTGQEQIHAHRIILCQASVYWRALLERWELHSRPPKLVVEEGERHAAYLLLKCLYVDTCLPDIVTSQDLLTIVAVLVLADENQVPAATFHCAQKLCRMTSTSYSASCPWALARKIWALPECLLGLQAIRPLLCWIQETILTAALDTASNMLPLDIELDVELIGGDRELYRLLSEMPLDVFAALLGDPRCRAANENTVAVILLWRLSTDKSRENKALREKLFVEVVRVPHLTALFAAAYQDFKPKRIVHSDMHAIAREGNVSSDLRVQALLKLRDTPMPKCWLEGPRPISHVTSLEKVWVLNEADVKSIYTRLSVCQGPVYFFEGVNWCFELLGLYAKSTGLTRLCVSVKGEYPLDSGMQHVVGAHVEVKVFGAWCGTEHEVVVRRAGEQFCLSGLGPREGDVTGPQAGWDDMFGQGSLNWDDNAMAPFIVNKQITFCIVIKQVL